MGLEEKQTLVWILGVVFTNMPLNFYKSRFVFLKWEKVYTFLLVYCDNSCQMLVGTVPGMGVIVFRTWHMVGT